MSDENESQTKPDRITLDSELTMRYGFWLAGISVEILVLVEMMK